MGKMNNHKGASCIINVVTVMAPGPAINGVPMGTAQPPFLRTGVLLFPLDIVFPVVMI